MWRNFLPLLNNVIIFSLKIVEMTELNGVPRRPMCCSNVFIVAHREYAITMQNITIQMIMYQHKLWNDFTNMLHGDVCICNTVPVEKRIFWIQRSSVAVKGYCCCCWCCAFFQNIRWFANFYHFFFSCFSGAHWNSSCSDGEQVSSSSEYHPYNAVSFDIPKPEIALIYGFPNVPPLQSSPNLPETSPTETNLYDLPPTTTTDAAIVDNDSTTILTGDSLISRKKRSLFHSQPKTIEITTTTPRPTRPTRPRTRYDDEGKWRIIRQEEDKQQKKYDYL